MRVSRVIRAAIATCTLAFSAVGVSAAEPVRLLFQPHGAFFSMEFHQKTPIDPQVFCKDSASPSALGPQGITHDSGVRNARLADPIELPLFTATGKPLPFTLGQWLDAAGNVSIDDKGTSSQVAMHFTHLVPNGLYSVFENHFETTPPTFTPLDGSGKENDFRAAADGTADDTIMVPHHLTHMSGLLVIYHSDNQSHGTERGQPGINAHHQLVVRIPER